MIYLEVVLTLTFLGLGVVYNTLVKFRQETRRSMSTTNQGLGDLQNAEAARDAAEQQLETDLQKLLSGLQQGPGLQPGQVVVMQADLDALTATVRARTAATVTDDASVVAAETPATPAPVTPAAKKA